MLWLIDNYDSFTYNLVHFIGELGVSARVVRNDAITAGAILAQKPRAIVLSPGPGTPDDAGICLELITQAGGEVPIFGVCLGHQAIAQAYGGKIVGAPSLMHGKVSVIANTGAGVFANLPETFAATRYHSLTVEPASLPATLSVTAECDDGVIMGLSHASAPVHGVQFHPESIASEYGHAILANFLRLAGYETRPIPESGAHAGQRGLPAFGGARRRIHRVHVALEGLRRVTSSPVLLSWLAGEAACDA